jgi:hypothetical protein
LIWLREFLLMTRRPDDRFDGIFLHAHELGDELFKQVLDLGWGGILEIIGVELDS